MTCRGCDANLGIARIKLEILNGRLIVVCPLCRYEHFAKTSKDGFVELIGEDE